MEERFSGFAKPESNYFRMPNEWINICADITNLAELKIIQYVLRHTWGFHEYGVLKTITVDEFMYGRKRADGTRMDRGTGLKSDRSVKDGIKAAIEHGYLVCHVDDRDKARIKKSYGLNINMGEEYNLPLKNKTKNRQVESTPQSGNNYPSGPKSLPPNRVDSTGRTEKDTLERNSRKTQEKEKGTSPQRNFSRGSYAGTIREVTGTRLMDINAIYAGLEQMWNEYYWVQPVDMNSALRSGASSRNAEELLRHVKRILLSKKTSV